MIEKIVLPSPIQRTKIKQLSQRNVQLWIKRDDLIHSEISGNKWRKLNYYVEHLKQLKKEGVFTFGGAFSNHLLATAAAGNLLNFKTIGIVRAEELEVNSNENLKRCAELGMELHFITRVEYKLKAEKKNLESWKERFMHYLYVPEGGAGFHGMLGCQEIWTELSEEIKGNLTQVYVAQGTTTTSCGILLGLPKNAQLNVVPVLKNFDSKAEMRSLLYQFLLNWETGEEYLERVNVLSDAHFGGYGKWNDELLNFRDKMAENYSLPLDKIYTAKAFWAMLADIEKRDLKNCEILFIHTGGLKNG